MCENGRRRSALRRRIRAVRDYWEVSVFFVLFNLGFLIVDKYRLGNGGNLKREFIFCYKKVP